MPTARSCAAECMAVTWSWRPASLRRSGQTLRGSGQAEGGPYTERGMPRHYNGPESLRPGRMVRSSAAPLHVQEARSCAAERMVVTLSWRPASEGGPYTEHGVPRHYNEPDSFRIWANGAQQAAPLQRIAGQGRRPRYWDIARWTRVRRATPVGPLASQGLASSFQAVPAISRWTQGVSPANSRMNQAPVMEPPPLPLPMF